MTQKRQRAYLALNKHIELIHESLKLKHEEVDLSGLEKLKGALDKFTEDFMEAHKAFYEVLDNDEEKQQSYIWFEIRDREGMECR